MGFFSSEVKLLFFPSHKKLIKCFVLVFFTETNAVYFLLKYSDKVNISFEILETFSTSTKCS